MRILHSIPLFGMLGQMKMLLKNYNELKADLPQTVAAAVARERKEAFQHYDALPERDQQAAARVWDALGSMLRVDPAERPSATEVLATIAGVQMTSADGLRALNDLIN